MRRLLAALAGAFVALALLAPVAQADVPLTVPQARVAFLKAEPHGRFHGCARRSASTLICRVDVREVATGEWEDPATGEWEVTGRAVYWIPAKVPIRLGGVDWEAARVL